MRAPCADVTTEDSNSIRRERFGVEIRMDTSTVVFVVGITLTGLVAVQLMLVVLQSTRELFVVAPVAELMPSAAHPETGKAWKDLRGELMNGRSGKDAGIVRQCAVGELPLGPKAKQALG